jgi:AcrR family transcriptional regulator
VTAAPRRRTKPLPRPPRDGERKRDATRKRLLDRALALFEDRGVEATTMRDIARAAKLSLGAAYYYFPSKEALVFAYYEDNHTQLEAALAGTTGTPRERLGAIFHERLAAMQSQRKMLAAIVGRLVDPGDPLSALSAQQRTVRARAIAVFARALDGANLPPEVSSLAAHALWLMMMACLLLYVHDESPGQARTHGLVDDALDLIVPMLPLLSTPMGRAVVDRITAALGRAGIQLELGPRDPGVTGGVGPGSG